jgi:hypothetical protein
LIIFESKIQTLIKKMSLRTTLGQIVQLRKILRITSQLIVYNTMNYYRAAEQIPLKKEEL